MDSSHVTRVFSVPVLAVFVLLALVGCATEEIPEASPDFGDSVRYTIDLQTRAGSQMRNNRNSLRIYHQDFGPPSAPTPPTPPTQAGPVAVPGDGQ